MKFKTIIVSLTLSLLSAISILVTDEARAQEEFQVATDDAGAQGGFEMESPGFVWGLGIGIVEQVYKGFDTRVIPIPAIGYNGDRLKVFGPFVRYEFLQQDKFKVAVQAAPRFNGYSNSDSNVFDGMDKRKASLDVGLGVKSKVDRWVFNASTMFDALGRSDGYELKGSIGRIFNAESFFVVPTLGLSYLSANNVDYYYGVKDSEATATRSAYEGESTINTTGGISFITPAFFKGQTRLTITNTWYGSEITDSPLTDKDTTLGIILAFARPF